MNPILQYLRTVYPMALLAFGIACLTACIAPPNENEVAASKVELPVPEEMHLIETETTPEALAFVLIDVSMSLDPFRADIVKEVEGLVVKQPDTSKVYVLKIETDSRATARPWIRNVAGPISCTMPRFPELSQLTSVTKQRRPYEAAKARIEDEELPACLKRAEAAAKAEQKRIDAELRPWLRNLPHTLWTDIHGGLATAKQMGDPNLAKEIWIYSDMEHDPDPKAGTSHLPASLSGITVHVRAVTRKGKGYDADKLREQWTTKLQDLGAVVDWGPFYVGEFGRD